VECEHVEDIFSWPPGMAMEKDFVQCENSLGKKSFYQEIFIE
jgi:hypothetical protein